MIRFTVGLISLFGYAASSSRSFHVESNFTDNLDVLSYEDQITHVFKERMPKLASRNDLVKKGSTERDHVHEVIFAVQMRNMDELTRIVHDISDPHSENYGNHLTREEMHDLISNPEACAEVTSYLLNGGATVISETNGGGYITAQAPITVWETMFKTDFFVFQQTHLNGETHEVVRAEHYSVPKEIHHHIEAVMNTIEMPILSHMKPKVKMPEVKFDKGRKLLTDGSTTDGTIYPNRIRYFYNMSNVVGSSLSTQATYGNGLQYFNPNDLEQFQRTVSYQPLQPAIIANGFTSTTVTDDVTEGNLDIQYLISLSPGSPTAFWHFDLSIGNWVVMIATLKVIPYVLSVSYGSIEDVTSKNENKILTTSAIQLSAMGITMVVASGDSGSADAPQCKYTPTFPASSVYFLSVGATMVSTSYVTNFSDDGRLATSRLCPMLLFFIFLFVPS